MPMRPNLAPRSFSCSICNESVKLETAKIDENGKPVHEECYGQQIRLRKSIRPPPEALMQMAIPFHKGSIHSLLRQPLRAKVCGGAARGQD